MKKDLGFKISPSVLLRVLRGYILLIICALCALAGCDSGSGDPTTYTVTYDLDGGSGTVPAAVTADSGSVITLPAGTGLTKTGFTFGGWTTVKDGTAISGTYTVTDNITLYAKWTPQQQQQPPTQITVTFDVNGGTPTYQPVTIDAGAALGNKYPSPDPVRAGWEFDGWYNSAKRYDRTTAISADITLTAQWEEEYVVENAQSPAIHPGNHFSETGGVERTVTVGENFSVDGLHANVETGAGVLTSKWYRVTSEADANAASVDNPTGTVVLEQAAPANNPHAISLPFTWHEDAPGVYWYYVIVTNTNENATVKKASSSITQNRLKVTVTD